MCFQNTPEGSSLGAPDVELYSDESDSVSGPPYTPRELGEIFLDFYKFLTTLHFDAADLKIPPPDGWPGITQETCQDFKSDLVTEVLRHLPYFDQRSTGHIFPLSKVVDYSSFSREDFQSMKQRDEWGIEFFSNEHGEAIDGADFVCLVQARQNGGCDLWLNVRECEILEDEIAWCLLGPHEVELFFNDLKEKFRNLKLIPCPGRRMWRAENVEDTDRHITPEEVMAQQRDDACTDLDIQYARQVYREHGWPDAFRMDEAVEVVAQVFNFSDDDAAVWPSSPRDY